MMNDFLTVFLFGSICVGLGAEIQRGRWESEINDCIDNRVSNNWRSALTQAVKNGDVESTTSLAKHCVKDKKILEEQLFNIAQRRDFTVKDDIVKALIDNGADVNAKNGNQSETPLHSAVCCDISPFVGVRDIDSFLISRFDIARIFIKHGANVNARDKDAQTPLHIAGEFGSPKIIKLLIENGADVNAMDEKGDTPLHKLGSNFRDKVDLAAAIIENAPNLILDVKNNDGNTPLEIALTNDAPKVARLIIEHDADISQTDDNGCNLMHRECSNQKTDRIFKSIVIKALIDRGMDVNAQNNDGDTCLHIIFGGRDLTDMLIRNGADISIKNKKGRLPDDKYMGYELELLQFFAELKHDADKAINNRFYLADINSRGYAQKTILFNAVDWNQTDAVRILVEHGAHVTPAVNYIEQYIPIHYAAYRGNAVVARYLVEHGADVNFRYNHMTALKIAVQNGYAHVAKVLIELGADINVRGFFQETPLHDAIRQGPVVVETLVDLGADLDAKTVDGKTPIHIAKERGKEEIVAILKAAKEKQNTLIHNKK